MAWKAGFVSLECLMVFEFPQWEIVRICKNTGLSYTTRSTNNLNPELIVPSCPNMSQHAPTFSMIFHHFPCSIIFPLVSLICPGDLPYGHSFQIWVHWGLWCLSVWGGRWAWLRHTSGDVSFSSLRWSDPTNDVNGWILHLYLPVYPCRILKVIVIVISVILQWVGQMFGVSVTRVAGPTGYGRCRCMDQRHCVGDLSCRPILLELDSLTMALGFCDYFALFCLCELFVCVHVWVSFWSWTAIAIGPIAPEVQQWQRFGFQLWEPYFSWY